MNPSRFKPGLYFRTVARVPPRQIYHRLVNALKWQIYRRFPRPVRRRYERRLPPAPATRPASGRIAWFEKKHDGRRGMFSIRDILGRRFTFLHRTRQFGDRISWRNPEFTYLWDFNLHYFEYLPPLARLLDGPENEESNEARRLISALLREWMESNPCPTLSGWHQYPLSLRIINWIKVFRNHPEFAEPDVRRNLYLQILFLENNLEYHLMVNHLLENARALIFGGLFFSGEDADRWLSRGLKIAEDQIREQVLPRGGHLERSPMYHCLVLEGLLDLYLYLEKSGRTVDRLRPPLEKMCRWLEYIRCPDGTFPLFNDSALGISAAPEEILNNASRIIGYRAESRTPDARDCDGYHIISAGPFFAVIDGAPIGPDYNPGHAHCDNLSYELFFRGRRLVVDTGTYGYDPGDFREYSRSTRGHNTVVINRLEQSEVWGSFRVGRRSNPDRAGISSDGDLTVFRGSYRNQLRPGRRINHHRTVVLSPSGWILFFDRLSARGRVTAESYVHLAPGWSIALNSGAGLLSHPGREDLYFYELGGAERKVFPGQYAPEFGKMIGIEILRLHKSGDRVLEMAYLFSADRFSAEPSLRVDRPADQLILAIGDTTRRVDLRG